MTAVEDRMYSPLEFKEAQDVALKARQALARFREDTRTIFVDLVEADSLTREQANEALERLGLIKIPLAWTVTVTHDGIVFAVIKGVEADDASEAIDSVQGDLSASVSSIEVEFEADYSGDGELVEDDTVSITDAYAYGDALIEAFLEGLGFSAEEE